MNPENPDRSGTVKEETPWHASYPAPQTVAASIPRQKVLEWLQGGKRVGQDFVLVDLRRTDFEVCSHTA